ncbi:hypothetical protein ACKWTF_011610 [Chironomus riparius]
MKFFSKLFYVFVVISIIDIKIGSSRSIRMRRSLGEWWNTVKTILSSNSNQVKTEIVCMDYSEDDKCLGDLVDDDPYEGKTVFIAPNGCPKNAKKDRAGRCRKILKSRN